MYLKKIKKGDKTYYILVMISDDGKNKVAKFIKESIFNALVNEGIKVYEI